MWIPKKIISGGQNGSDLAGILGAEKAGVNTGGVAPKHYKTESGPQPEVLRNRFGLTEHTSSDYKGRTEVNVINADATIIFAAKMKSAGSKLTVDYCVKHQKPYLLINPFDEDVLNRVHEFIQSHRPLTLNIAGNRESVAPGITRRVAGVMYAALKPKVVSNPAQNNDCTP